MCDRCIVFMAHVNSVCTHTSEVLGPSTDRRKLFLRTGTKGSFHGWPSWTANRVWRFGRTILWWPNFQPSFSLVQKTYAQSTAASRLGTQRCQSVVQRKQMVPFKSSKMWGEFNKGAIYKGEGTHESEDNSLCCRLPWAFGQRDREHPGGSHLAGSMTFGRGSYTAHSGLLR